MKKPNRVWVVECKNDSGKWTASTTHGLELTKENGEVLVDGLREYNPLSKFRLTPYKAVR